MHCIFNSIYKSIIQKIITNEQAFVHLIPAADQCLSTACIGPHHCGHWNGAVMSRDKHWHAVLEHCLALLQSYDSSTAVSAVTGRSCVRVTVLGHCQALPYDSVTASMKDLYQMWKNPEQCSKHCLSVLSFTVSPAAVTTKYFSNLYSIF